MENTHQCTSNCRRNGHPICSHGKNEDEFCEFCDITEEERNEAMNEMECWKVQNHIKECNKCNPTPTTQLQQEEWIMELDKTLKNRGINGELLWICDFIRSLKSLWQKEAREEIQQDICSVYNMLNGETERKKIANFIKEYLLNSLK